MTRRDDDVDLFDVIRSCFRRWYIVLPLLLITLWYSYSTYSAVKPVYYADAVIGITPPSDRIDQATPGAPVPRNGLLDVGGAPLVAKMGQLALEDPSVAAKVVEAGGVPHYGARMFPMAGNVLQLPLIMIDVTDPDPTAVTKTLEIVIQQAAGTFRRLQQQAQVPDDQMVTPFVVSPPSTPAAGMPSRTRSTIAIFAAGTGLTVILGVVVDVILTRRKSRKSAALTQDQTQPAVELGPDQKAEAHDQHARNAVAAEETIEA